MAKYDFRISKNYNIPKLIKTQTVKIFNGTRHTLFFYDFSNKRDNEKKIEESDTPVCTFEPNKVLNVRYSREIVYGDKQYVDVECLNEKIYKENDIILVSKTYLDKINEKIDSGFNYDEDYLDRLYIQNVVIREGKAVGFKDIRKAFPPKDPYEYVEMIKNNKKPSLMAMLDSLAKYDEGEFDMNYYDDNFDAIDEAAIVLKYIIDGYSKNRNKSYCG